ncbi:MAG: hypothetical protein PHE12_02895, partial [Clostridia bacterium]|nr:hypothetical protein [Clostridia bacterium]
QFVGNVKEDFIFSFADFYRQLADINDKIFEELLLYNTGENEGAKFSGGKELQNELMRCKELYRRRNLLSRLKKADYDLSVKKESFLLARIKKLEFETDKLLKQQDGEFEGFEKSVKAVDKKGKPLKEILSEITKADGEFAQKIINEGGKE